MSWLRLGKKILSIPIVQLLLLLLCCYVSIQQQQRKNKLTQLSSHTMEQKILITGATGNLGFQIAENLVQLNAIVIAIVRQSTSLDKIAKLQKIGVQVLQIDIQNIDAVAKACAGVSCVVSALSGLEDVIIDTQKILLDAAVKAGVPRFIPSDYSLDFTKFNDSENRNLDWRRKFHQYLDVQPIKATSIFNGAFMDMLTNEIPMIIFKKKLVLHWGSANHKMCFTKVSDVAKYTAHAALDAATPRYLYIAGAYISPSEVREIASTVYGTRFKLLKTGGKGLLGFIIKMTKLFSPAKSELYPAWQGMQYMHNMIDERASNNKWDTNRYGDLQFTNVNELLTTYKASTGS
jgi:nucleoside-diphosphate-sugar epimerase